MGRGFQIHRPSSVILWKRENILRSLMGTKVSSIRTISVLKGDFVEFHKCWWKLEEQIKQGMNSKQNS